MRLRLLLVLSSSMSMANEGNLSFEKCSSAQKQDLLNQVHLLKVKLRYLLNEKSGLPLYRYETVEKVFISKKKFPEANPNLPDAQLTYTYIHSKLLKNFAILQKALEKPYTFRCEKLESNKTCQSSAQAYVDINESHMPVDNRIHVCPAHFKARFGEAVGNIAHELSHLVLYTPHDHPSVKFKEPLSYYNIIKDAYVYEKLVSSTNFEETLAERIWRYFWYDDKSQE